jgi:PAS domain S-box-containing protein
LSLETLDYVDPPDPDVPEHEKLEARLRMIVHAWPIPAWVLNANDRSLLVVNDEFCALLGYTEQELLKTEALMLVPEEDEDLAANAMCIAHEPRAAVEWRLRHRSGRVLDVLCRYRALRFRDADGNVLHCFLVAAVNQEAESMSSDQLYRST